MDIFMKILGLLISLAILYIGVRFAFFPKKSIQSLQKMKYQEAGTPGKRERIFSMVTGIIFLLIGIYYLVFVILSFVFPE